MMVDSVQVANGGQGFTSSESFIGGSGFGQPPERFSSFRSRYDQQLPQVRSQGSGTSGICWGGVPDNLEAFTSKLKYRSPQDAPQEPERDKTIRLRERLRYVEKVKIASEQDEETYVIVERVRAWVGDGSDGNRWILECKPDGEKIVVAKGAPVNVP